MRGDLSGRVCVVTGASRGVGRACALAFAAAGADLALLARAYQDLHEVAFDCENAGAPRAMAFSCDLADLEAVRAATRQVVARFGRIDILVNNLVARGNGVQETLDYALAIGREMGAEIARAGGGIVINIATMAPPAALAAGPELSQEQLQQLTRMLADELGYRGVRVVGVHSGGRVATGPVGETASRNDLVAPDVVAAAVLHAGTTTDNQAGTVLDARAWDASRSVED